MKLVKQSCEILEQTIPVRKLDDYSGSHFREEYMKELYKHIERCGRVCYHSLDKITENSAEKFVNGLIKSKHLSVLEHGVIYLNLPKDIIDWYDDDFGNSIPLYVYSKYKSNEYSIVSNNYVSTNYRVIIENGWEDDLQYLCEPTEYHDKRHTVLLHTCIHVYKDLTRHRKMSFSIESTRYCNYSKGKFGGELKFIEPCWWSKDKSDYTLPNVDNIFLTQLALVEEHYLYLVNNGWQPQQAAEILPQCTAADVVMSGFDKDWDFVFRLRSDIAETGKPHPLVEEIMTPLRDEFTKNGWVLPF